MSELTSLTYKDVEYPLHIFSDHIKVLLSKHADWTEELKDLEQHAERTGFALFHLTKELEKRIESELESLRKPTDTVVIDTTKQEANA